MEMDHTVSPINPLPWVVWLLAIPVAAIVQVAFDEAFVSRRERRQDIDRAGTLLRRVD